MTSSSSSSARGCCLSLEWEAVRPSFVVVDLINESSRSLSPTNQPKNEQEVPILPGGICDKTHSLLLPPGQEPKRRGHPQSASPSPNQINRPTPPLFSHPVKKCGEVTSPGKKFTVYLKVYQQGRNELDSGTHFRSYPGIQQKLRRREGWKEQREGGGGRYLFVRAKFPPHPAGLSLLSLLPGWFVGWLAKFGLILSPRNSGG